MTTRTIVVVDDDKAIRELFAFALEEEGYQVVACDTHEDVLPCVKRQVPDLVIVDLWLKTPQDGWEIYRKLSRDSRTATIPIVILTAADLGTVQAPDDLPPPAAFLPKPFDLADLLTTIQAALRT